MTGKYTLKQGPSREELFDCLRLNSVGGKMSFVDFWGIVEAAGMKSGSRLDIKIEGVHMGRNDGRDWFFWGRQVRVAYGESFAEILRVEELNFCFGRWDTYHRTGTIQFGSTSFFADPPLTEDQKWNTMTGEGIPEDCTLGQLPFGRHEIIFTVGQYSARLEIQRHEDTLGVRTIHSESVRLRETGEPLRKRNWEILKAPVDTEIKSLLLQKLEFLK